MADKRWSWLGGIKKVFKPIQAAGLAVTRFIDLVLVALVYFLAIGPLSLVLRVTRQKLLEAPALSDGTYWVGRPQPVAELEKFQRQF